MILFNCKTPEQKENEWWVDYYSRATYYRLKTRALEEFLFYVNVY
ncbi:MG284/MPN403 family protein [Thomasclavelia spiroformis]